MDWAQPGTAAGLSSVALPHVYKYDYVQCMPLSPFFSFTRRIVVVAGWERDGGGVGRGWGWGGVGGNRTGFFLCCLTETQSRLYR